MPMRRSRRRCSTAPRRSTRDLAPGRKAYVQVVRGSVDVNGQRLSAGDAAALSGEKSLSLANGDNAEVLVFDLA